MIFATPVKGTPTSGAIFVNVRVSGCFVLNCNEASPKVVQVLIVSISSLAELSFNIKTEEFTTIEPQCVRCSEVFIPVVCEIPSVS